MVDGNALIAEQLAGGPSREVALSDGRTTVVTPARFSPVCAGPRNRLSLNGRWRVLKHPFPAGEESLAAANADETGWAEVEQPGKVFYCDPEEQASSVPNWNRVTLAHIAEDDGAVLRKRALIPAGWAGRRVFLRFEGIYPAARVYLNGALLGEHLSGLTPVEWDVTDRVVPGSEALVAVRLLRKHRFVQMDMPRHATEFAGISQDAYFHAAGQCRIADYHLVSTADPAARTGTIEGTVTVRNHGAAPCAARLAVVATSPEGRRKTILREERAVPAGGEAVWPVRGLLKKIALWNDEFPNLYTVALRLDGDAAGRQETVFRTGFRLFSTAGARPTLNGSPVKFRGVCHLTFHPEHGMYTPEPWLRRCLQTMKRANVNAIRTHFLGPAVLGDLCDEMGVYLLQELPIDWGHDYVHDPASLGPALTRIEGAVRRDRHHPSVMVWSIGNENLPRNMAEHDDFFNHLRIYDRLAKTLDPSRPTMFPPPGPANKIEGIFETRVGDIADTHYSFKVVRKLNETGSMTNPKTWKADMETVTREEAMAAGWSGVWFSSEYGLFNYLPDVLNGPYLSVIADRQEEILSGKSTLDAFADRLREEWGYMRDDPTCLGGAYFPWLCSGAGDPWGWVRWGEDADWGVVTAELLPKPAFWAMRAIFSPVAFPARVAWMPGQEEIVFETVNGYNAVDLSECTLRTMMGGGGRWLGMLREWRDVPVSGRPGERVTVRIPIWNPATRDALEKGSAVVCRCVLLDPRRYRPVTADVLVVPRTAADVKAAMPVGPDAV